jgi:predicted PurR-regulated permease PerM
MAKKPPSDSFKSIQILSAKAQSLWAMAKARMQAAQTNGRTMKSPSQSGERRLIVFVDVTAATVAKTTLTILLVIFAAWVFAVIRDKILVMLLAFFLAIVMDSHVRRLERWGFPRSLAVILLYLLFLSIAFFLVASLIPIVATQIQDLARLINRSADTFLSNPNVHLSFLSESINERLTILTQEALQTMGIKDRASALFQFGQNLSAVAQTSITFAVQIAGSMVNFLMTFIMILFLAFFIQMEREKVADFARVLLPRNFRGYYDTKAEAIYLKMSQWFQGQMILCFAIGVLTFIALEILGMPYAVTLALFAGFTEFIPYAGPLIGAIPAVFIALTQFGPVWALVIAGVFYIVQLCENNLLVPLVMKHAVGLSPIAIMFGMLVGISFPDTIHPVLGILLAVPATAIITIFMQDLYMLRKRK